MPGWSYDTPKAWTSTRRRILKRDRGICYICGRPGADQVDAKIPESQGGQHVDSNLGAIHSKPCHEDKTRHEIAAGRARKSRLRTTEPHPGLLPKGGG